MRSQATIAQIGINHAASRHFLVIDVTFNEPGSLQSTVLMRLIKLLHTPGVHRACRVGNVAVLHTTYRVNDDVEVNEYNLARLQSRVSTLFGSVDVICQEFARKRNKLGNKELLRFHRQPRHARNDTMRRRRHGRDRLLPTAA